jgi:hypothetical protein
MATASVASSTDVALVTVPNIEILEVGEQWELSTGPVDFTPEQLIAAIESQQDPAVRTPVLKLGHVDPRFDGQPSFGRLQNLRLTNNGNTLVADAVGVPLWLAKCMASAYPRRSIEGAFNVTTRTGNTWGLVLTGLSLLGDMYPGVETLEDLELLWGSAPPPLYPVNDVDELAATGPYFRGIKQEDHMGADWLRRKKDTTTVQAAAQSIAAAASLDDVRQAYYESLGPAQTWWWIREIQVNPLSLIVDDDEGSLWQVPVTVDGSDNIAFGDPVEVKVEYVAAGSHRQPGQLLAASYAEPEDTGRSHKEDSGEPTAAGTDPENTGSATVQPNNTEPEAPATMNLRQLLGLPETATDAEVEAARLKALQDSAPQTPAATPAPNTDGNPSSQPETPATEPGAQPATATQTGSPDPVSTPDPKTEGTTPAQPAAPTGLQIPEGMQLIDAATLAQLQQGVAASSQLVAAQARRDKDAALDGAIRAGKFPPSRRAHYEKLYDADKEGTVSLLASLAANTIPVQERGELTGEENTAPTETAYPTSWKRHVTASRRGISRHVKVVQD